MKSKTLVSVFVASSVLIGATWLAAPPFAYSAESCASLSTKRAALFHEHAYYLTKVRGFRSQLATMDTADPAVIDAQLDKFTKVVKKVRESRQRATPSEEIIFAKLYAGYENALEFWR